MKQKYIFGGLLSILLIFLDFISKKMALLYLSGDIPLIGNFLFLELFKNPGIAFSFPIVGIPLKILTLILIFAIFYYYIRVEEKNNNFLIDFAFLLIISGAIGNGWERIFFSEVIDFIGIQGFAIFNFADIYISLGGCIYLVTQFIGVKKIHLDQNK